MNTFINLVKKSSVERGIKSRVRSFEEIGALVGASSLPVLDFFARFWAPASLSSSLTGSAKVLTQGLWQAQDLVAIAMELKSKKHDTVLLNGLVDPLSMELLEL